MPMPIRPISDMAWYGKEDRGQLSIDLDTLSKAISGYSTSAGWIEKTAASDEDADILFDLWRASSVVEEGESPSLTRYAIPQQFPDDSLMRLKAANLVSGDGRTIRFTGSAIGVIRTMVLAEENAYEKTAVKKPYSVILAEVKATSGRSGLAFGNVTASAQVKTAQNVVLPAGRIPQANTRYTRSQRLVCDTGGHNKEYTVRIYQYPDGMYSVVAWSGRIDGALRAQPKVFTGSLALADHAFHNLINEKTSKPQDPYFLAGESPNVPGSPTNPASVEPTSVQTAVPRPTRTSPSRRPRTPTADPHGPAATEQRSKKQKTEPEKQKDAAPKPEAAKKIDEGEAIQNILDQLGVQDLGIDFESDEQL